MGEKSTSKIGSACLPRQQGMYVCFLRTDVSHMGEKASQDTLASLGSPRGPERSLQQEVGRKTTFLGAVGGVSSHNLEHRSTGLLKGTTAKGSTGETLKSF